MRGSVTTERLQRRCFAATRWTVSPGSSACCDLHSLRPEWTCCIRTFVSASSPPSRSVEKYSKPLSSRPARCQIQRASSTVVWLPCTASSSSGRKHHKWTRLNLMLAAELSTAKKDAMLGEISRSHLGPRGFNEHASLGWPPSLSKPTEDL